MITSKAQQELDPWQYERAKSLMGKGPPV